MKNLGKILKIFSFSVLTLAMVVVAVLLTVLKWPQLVLNDRNLERVPGLARRAGVEVHWGSGHISVDSLALLRKRVSLDFSDFCLKIGAASNRSEGCFERVQLSALASLSGFKPRLLELGPATLNDGKVSVAIGADSSNEKSGSVQSPSEKNGGIQIPKSLRQTKLLPVHIDIPDWKLRLAENTFSGGVVLDSRSDARGHASITAQASARTSGGDSVKANFQLDNPKGFWTLEEWKLATQAKGALQDGTKLGLDAQVNPRGNPEKLDFDYRIDARYAKSKAIARLRATGAANPDRMESHFEGSADLFFPQFSKIWVHDCALVLARESSEILPGSLKLNCPVGFHVPPPPKDFPNIKVPTKMGVHVMADLKTGAYPPSPGELVDGHVSIELDPLLTPVFEGGGEVRSHLSGVPTEFPRGWKMDTDLGLRLTVPHFENLVKQLARGPLDIWAPARVLKGKVEFALKGKFDATSGTAPVTVTTRLASATQKLDVDATGTVTLRHLQPKPAVDLQLDVVLSDVLLQLPPIPDLKNLKDLPRYLPDDRIHSLSKAAIQEPVFTYDVTIHTRDEAHPVRLLTPKISAPVPLGVQLALASDAPLSGSIRLLQFPLKLFKRDVELDHLTYDFRYPSPDSALDGKIIVPYTDYTITILILGTSGKPQLRFLSDPPLPQQQILATLIFGQPMEALDPDQSRSVGEAQAALASGAMSLASLYLLGRFNVESLTFNPETGMTSLRYRLAEGTSLNVSRNREESKFGIRKRLTEHLSITTALNTPTDQSTRNKVSTFLEWTYQY